MNILITSGATREPIDKVRFITNLSTGKTGAALADELFNLRHNVTYLHGESAAKPSHASQTLVFQDFKDLDNKIRQLMKDSKIDVVIHLAAVSDYSVKEIRQKGHALNPEEVSKIPSESELEVVLKPNYKILNRIKDYSTDGKVMVIGFKLTCTDNEKLKQQAVERIFGAGSVDLVVQNDLNEIKSEAQHPFHIYNIFEKVGSCLGSSSLATKLNELIQTLEVS